MDSASDSLTAAVEGLLEEVVSTAMGPPPMPKRKQPEARTAERPSEGEGAKAAWQGAEAVDAEPLTKKPKPSPTAAPLLLLPAPEPAAPTCTPTAGGHPRMAAALAPVQVPMLVDLEAAVCELMGSQELLGTKSPAVDKAVVEEGSVAAPHQPTDAVAVADCATAPLPDTQAPGASPVGTMAPPAAATQASVEPTAEESRQQPADSCNLQPSETLPKVGLATAAVVQPAVGADVVAAEQQAAPISTAAPIGMAAPSNAGVVPAEQQAAPIRTAAPSKAAAAAATAAPTSLEAAPMSCSTAAGSAPTGPAAAPACPSLAHHPLPTTTEPTTKEPTTLPPSASAAVAAAAVHDACMAAAAAGTAEAATEPHSGACAATIAATAHVSPTTASDGHYNMLKGDIDQVFYDTGSPSPSNSMCGNSWRVGSSEDVELPQVTLPTSHHHHHGPPKKQGPVTIIAGYTLEGTKAGSGGLGVVYPAVHQPSGQRVALKLGSTFDAEQGKHDFTWETFRTEWNTYCALAGKALPWLAEPFEMGLMRDERGVAPWITMSLLGPSLHTLNHPCKETSGRGWVQPQLGAYARGMLAALEGLHAHGFLHHDLKPANFTVARGFDPRAAAVAGAPPPQIFLIDFGFSHRFDPAATGGPMPFVGTPDYAATAALQGRAPGPRDDLEALGYTLVELALGELPWDVTKHATQPSCAARRDTCGWTEEQLAGMAEARDHAWQQQISWGHIPAWLQQWVAYCRSLAPAARPDYEHLRLLISAGEREAAAAAAKAAAAQAGSSAWLAAAEE